MTQRLYLIRHCKAEGQEPDAPLTSEGRLQAKQLAEFLSDKGIERIVSSPFVRACETVDPLAQKLNIPVEIDERLRERVLSVAWLPNWLECLRESFSDFDLSFCGGESNREAMERAVHAVRDYIGLESTTTIAIVTHGNLLTLLLRHFDGSYGFEEWKRLSYPDVFLVECPKDGLSVVRVWRDTEV